MTTLTTQTPQAGSSANRALKTSARLWFLTAVAGQWAFVHYILGRYYNAMAQGKMDTHTVRRSAAGLAMALRPLHNAGN